MVSEALGITRLVRTILKEDNFFKFILSINNFRVTEVNFTYKSHDGLKLFMWHRRNVVPCIVFIFFAVFVKIRFFKTLLYVTEVKLTWHSTNRRKLSGRSAETVNWSTFSSARSPLNFCMRYWKNYEMVSWLTIWAVGSSEVDESLWKNSHSGFWNQFSANHRSSELGFYGWGDWTVYYRCC